MKKTLGFKILSFAFIITAIMSSFGIYAGSTFFNLSVPGFNGSATTSSIYRSYYGSQGINNITTNPTYDSLDVVPQRFEGSNFQNAGAWLILKNGTSITLQIDSSLGGGSGVLYDGTFRLYVDSRWNYISSTGTTGTWIW